MKKYVSNLKDLKNNISIDLKGDVSDIIKAPKSWAEAVAEAEIVRYAHKIIEARKLGEEFGNKIKTK